MNDEEQSAQNKGGAQEITAPKTTENPLAAQPATEQELRDAEQKIEQQIDERMTGFERSMVRLTRFGLAVTILTGIVFAGQLYEMISGGTQTDKLIGYAKTQAEFANKIAGASSDFTDSAYWMEQHMDDAATAMQDSVDTASGDTKTTIRNAQQAFRDEQRAWLGMSFMQHDGPQEIKPDTDVIFTAMLNNTGRTPALHTMPTIHWRLLGPTDALVSTSLVGEQGLAVVFPNAPQGLATTAVRFTQPQLDEVKNGIMVFKIWGEVVYDDVYRRPHWTHFCAILGKNVKDVYACDSYNETDDKPN
jgi:hypothetical protein